MNFNKNHVGVAVGTVYAIVALVWSVIVAVGSMQALMDWSLGTRFLDSPFEVQAFSFGTAVILIVLKFISGYILGWLFASIYNSMSRRKERVEEIK